MLAGGWVLIGLVLAAEPDAPAVRGEQLARSQCSSCHAYTPPEALTKKGWRAPLLHMVTRLGLAEEFVRDPPSGFDRKDLLQILDHLVKLKRLDTPLLPDEPLVSKPDFLAIWSYLVEHAGEEPAPQLGKSPVATGRTPFRLGPRIPYDPAVNVLATLVSIDPGRRRVFVGGVRDFDEKLGRNPAYLSILDSAGAVRGTIDLDSAPVSLDRTGPDYLLTEIGSLPTIQSRDASLLRLSVKKKDRLRTSVILDHQVRAAGSTVRIEPDGARLIAFNGFGYYLGELALLRESKGEIVSRKTLLEEPGALLSRFVDLDGDGRTDVLSLVSQHHESLLLFAGDGQGGYERVDLIRHHPAWGSSYFDLADLNGDGRTDVVLSNGDNSDYDDPPLKSYHGVRIYVNVAAERETPRLEERYFEPIHGAYQVLARDFDLDSDVDLVVLSRYLDERQLPRENFVYMENQTPRGSAAFRFAVSAIKELEGSDLSRMDAGDVDGDGDVDVVLGGAQPLDRPKRRSDRPPLGVAYLINQTRNGDSNRN